MRYFRYISARTPHIMKTDDNLTEYNLLGLHRSNTTYPIGLATLSNIKRLWKEITEEEAFLELV